MKPGKMWCSYCSRQVDDWTMEKISVMCPECELKCASCGGIGKIWIHPRLGLFSACSCPYGNPLRGGGTPMPPILAGLKQTDAVAVASCNVREHAGLEKVIQKLGMAQHILPDPELGQDVAFLGHVIGTLEKELESKRKALKEAEEENSKFMKRLARYKGTLEKIQGARRSGCSTGEAMSKTECWAREALGENPEGTISTVLTSVEAKACLTLGGRKTTEAEVARFVDEVKLGIPVMPVSFFCDFLKQWALLASTPYPEEQHDQENKIRQESGERARDVFLQIRKSNLLWRLIYAGEPLRTVPCPEHKGRWSGCNKPEDTACKGACMFESNVTGWLPAATPGKKE